MSSRNTVLLAAIAIALLGGCAQNAGAPSLARSATVLKPQQIHAIPIGTPPPTVNTCGSGPAQCHAKERVDIPALPDSPALAAAAIPGLHPGDIQSAYRLPVGTQTAATIAIVVAYSDPNAERDLAVYRAKFGLPACTVAARCLRFYGNVRRPVAPAPGGAGSGPADAGWATETSIDLDVASAACPSCTLSVFEAADDTAPNLIAAELAAVSTRPAVISNSWSISETSALTILITRFAHPGIAVVAGSGDTPATVSWPAADPSVIAVGGTTLWRDTSSSRGWTEAGWRDAGYGCSLLNLRPSWQPVGPCGTQRAVADIAAVADPLSGVAIYDTYGGDKAHPGSSGGWEVYGGTSVATPVVAGAIALAGNGAQLSSPAYIYAHAAALNPVSSPVSPLQVGLGSPNGTGAL